jgi:hypothetical protein
MDTQNDMLLCNWKSVAVLIVRGQVEDVEKLPADDAGILLTPTQTILTRFAEIFLMGHGPGNAGNRQSDQQQIQDLGDPGPA